MTDLIDPAAILFVAIALVIIAGGVMRAWKPVRRIVRWLDKLIGDPDDERNPGILARMDSFEQQLGDVLHEVTLNHGGSMKDALARVETTQGKILEHQQLDHGRLNRLEQVAETVEQIHELIDPDD